MASPPARCCRFVFYVDVVVVVAEEILTRFKKLSFFLNDFAANAPPLMIVTVTPTSRCTPIIN